MYVVEETLFFVQFLKLNPYSKSLKKYKISWSAKISLWFYQTLTYILYIEFCVVEKWIDFQSCNFWIWFLGNHYQGNWNSAIWRIIGPDLPAVNIQAYIVLETSLSSQNHVVSTHILWMLSNTMHDLCFKNLNFSMINLLMAIFKNYYLILKCIYMVYNNKSGISILHSSGIISIAEIWVSVMIPLLANLMQHKNVSLK